MQASSPRPWELICAIQGVFKAFRSYATVSHRRVILPFQKYQLDPRSHSLLPELGKRVGNMMQAVKRNADLLKDIAAACSPPQADGEAVEEESNTREPKRRKCQSLGGQCCCPACQCHL